MAVRFWLKKRIHFAAFTISMILDLLTVQSTAALNAFTPSTTEGPLLMSLNFDFMSAMTSACASAICSCHVDIVGSFYLI